jgi:hypothetical protein
MENFLNISLLVVAIIILAVGIFVIVLRKLNHQSIPKYFAILLFTSIWMVMIIHTFLSGHWLNAIGFIVFFLLGLYAILLRYNLTPKRKRIMIIPIIAIAICFIIASILSKDTFDSIIGFLQIAICIFLFFAKPSQLSVK